MSRRKLHWKNLKGSPDVSGNGDNRGQNSNPKHQQTGSQCRGNRLAVVDTFPSNIGKATQELIETWLR